MNITVKFPVPDLYGDTSSSSEDKEKSPESSKKSSSESSSSSNTSSQPAEAEPAEPVRFHVRIPRLFRIKDLHDTLLNVWSTRPAAHYLQPLNRSRLRNANRSVWLKPQGQLVQDLVVKYRAAFVTALETATSASECRAACQEFERKITEWTKKLEHHAKSSCRGKKVKGATALEVRHRASGLSYETTLKKLGNDPSLANLRLVRTSLKELWCLKNLHLDY